MRRLVCGFDFVVVVVLGEVERERKRKEREELWMIACMMSLGIT